MFRATSCSSSGGQIVLIQHLVSSLSVCGRPVPEGHLQRVTIPDAVLIQFDLQRVTIPDAVLIQFDHNLTS